MFSVLNFIDTDKLMALAKQLVPISALLRIAALIAIIDIEEAIALVVAMRENNADFVRFIFLC